MTDRELETEFEDVVVCPYCGHRQQDDDGYYRLHGDGEYECPNCGKPFDLVVHEYIEYSTSKKED